MPLAFDSDDAALFHKLAADNYRYVLETSMFCKSEEIRAKALEAYQESQKYCDLLSKGNPIALGLALNYSVFYKEFMNDQE